MTPEEKKARFDAETERLFRGLAHALFNSRFWHDGIADFCKTTPADELGLSSEELDWLMKIEFHQWLMKKTNATPIEEEPT